MKVAVSGNGQADKTLLSALLAKTSADGGCAAIAIDADPGSRSVLTGGGAVVTPRNIFQSLLSTSGAKRPASEVHT